MIKRLIALAIALTIVASFSMTAFAYEADCYISGGGSQDLHQLYMPAGSYTGRVGVTTFSRSDSSSSLQVVLYGKGFTACQGTFSSSNSSVTNGYTLGGLTLMHCGAEEYGSGTVNARVTWDYAY